MKVMEVMDNSGPWAKALAANLGLGTLVRTRRGRHGLLSELGILDYMGEAQLWIRECFVLWRR